MKYPDLFILLGHSMLLCMYVGFMSILMDGMNTSVRCSAQVVWNVLRVYDVYLSPVLLVDEGLSSSSCVRLCLWSSYILTFWTHSWGERPKRACWRVGNFATSLEIGQSCERPTKAKVSMFLKLQANLSCLCFRPEFWAISCDALGQDGFCITSKR
jgi:hypothetical protein